ncbi:Palmitoyltransferase [Coniosporium tulheliwenetii]|uniref:Palmitoyltransferase n=1 Tax=Coniosporium tulheliwenetii TaxID=3383036 RepID=A0ACC2ZG53_9PEZI|nr:Palmitoyltransferase [Cladosporium sp. JES 115]
MAYLEYFLYIRAAVLWKDRKMPSYLGPSPAQLIHLFVLVVANSITLFALSILLAQSLWGLASNTTTIERWEIERHEALLRRARHLGGFLDGPDGQRVRITRQEFPYDIGIWKNIKQGMGSGNPLSWFWPLVRSPSVESGLEFEVNGFEDSSVTWPPPDPDRIPRVRRQFNPEEAFIHKEGYVDTYDEVEAFRQRQQEDLQRWKRPPNEVQRRRPFHERLEKSVAAEVEDGYSSPDEQDGAPGEEAWRNSEGERLADFGVEEDVDFYDEDEVPLADLLRRRKAASGKGH